MAMYLNECWKLNPNLAWTVSWLNGMGGFVFFISGFFGVIPGDTMQSTIFPLGYLIGSVLYLGGSVGALMMWRKRQSGDELSSENRSVHDIVSLNVSPKTDRSKARFGWIITTD